MEEKIALVTGASRGIGSQIAKTLAKKNIFVVVNYSGSKEKADGRRDHKCGRKSRGLWL